MQGKRRYNMAFGVAMIAAGLMIIGITLASGPLFIQVDQQAFRHFDTSGPNTALVSELATLEPPKLVNDDDAFHRENKKAIGKEMAVGGVVSVIGVFMAVFAAWAPKSKG